MNWEAIAALGEIIGAFGVIVTLAFLAFQIRQNTRLLQTNTTQLEQNQEFAAAEAIGQSNQQQASMLAIAQSGELSAILDKGLRCYGELSKQEKLRFANLMGPLMGGVATQWERQQLLSSDIQDVAPDHLLFALDYLSTPGGSQWWRQYREMYPARFRACIDDALAKRQSNRENA